MLRKPILFFKIIFHSLFLFFFFSPAFSDTTISMPVTLTVAPVFSLSISSDTISFGEVRPGGVKFDVPPESMRLTAVTNMGNQWTLKVSASTDFVNQSFSSVTLPLSTMRWSPVYSEFSNPPVSAPGTLHSPPTGESFPVPMSTSDANSLVYTSSATGGDLLTDGTKVDLMFGVVIPTDAKAGIYKTTVTFTMTE